jgi:pSer/pThr/pTyr-binding forkhead associated (FHA) protein
MPYIQLRDRQYPIGQGQLRVGTSAYADVRVPGAETDLPQALVDVGADAQAAIRRGSPEAVVKVNGVILGPEPTPLIHGDKIEIGGVELLFGDDRAAGSTQYLGGPRGIAKPVGPPPEKATAATGGRLVSLVDGREYTIPAGGVTIGRDASCEVVVPSTEVSRRHAMIAPAEAGYMLSDLSTNGVLVNGERVSRTRILGRGDMIRIGGEEFRFHADPQSAAAPAESAAPAAASVHRTPSAHEPVGTGGSAAGGGDIAAGPPADQPVHPAAIAEEAAGAAVGASTARPRPALAVLEIVNEGILKGKRFEIRTPLVHVGRGAHNDVAIQDDSVSDSHAKIQKRETGWYVVDMDSTNGTYVGGRRISGEKHLVGSPDIRFGGIKMTFQVAAEPADDAKGTRAIAGMRPSRPAAAVGRTVTASAPVAASVVAEVPAEKPARGLGWVWIAVIVLMVGAVFFMLWGSR